MPAVTIPNTFTPSTTISSSQVNANFTAVANGIIASLGLAGADTMTGQFKAANGTAAAPGMTFGSDLDTGIYRPAANQLGFTTAGVLAGFFDDSGKLWLEDGLDIAGAIDVAGTSIFTGVASFGSSLEIGHASDTTLSRVSAGDLRIETNIIYRALGTDVAIADGGTGASTAAAAFTNLKQAASDTATGVLEIAIQSEMETPASALLAVTPARQHFHPGHPKAGGCFNGTGTPAFRTGDYGMGAVTDNGVGRYTLAFDTAFSTTDFWVALTTQASGVDNARVPCESGTVARTTSSVTMNVDNAFSNAGQDMEFNSIAAWGDYA